MDLQSVWFHMVLHGIGVELSCPPMDALGETVGFLISKAIIYNLNTSARRHVQRITAARDLASWILH